MAPDLRGAQWRKSSFSGHDGGDCVEVASNLPSMFAVRDSKNATGPALVFTRSEWSAFLNGVKAGTLSA
ncbi:DUF397 domain-containing protein [Sphaerisporangium corydalis]|uniref:DUF397 domain-containing protein n=1 Tax=Sphaerisporangium corydalis TaxID=1441875 RepID=A0ABV9EG07_9ACTN|nr:DUF397 domain-containing protein [Sphaerisporangium corydalis]